MSPYPVVVIVVNAQYMLLMYCVAASVRIRCAPSASPRSSYSRAYAESQLPSGSSGPSRPMALFLGSPGLGSAVLVCRYASSVQGRGRDESRFVRERGRRGAREPEH